MHGLQMATANLFWIFKKLSGGSAGCVVPDRKGLSCSWDKDLVPPTRANTCSRTGAASAPEHLNATALALSRVTSQDIEKGPNPFESLLLQSFGSSTDSPASVCS